MPELPDVEGFKKMIDDHCLGKRLVGAEPIRQPGQKVRALQMDTEDFSAAAVGRVWESTERRGKFLMIVLDDGNRIVLHFMLTGDPVYHEPPAAGRPVAAARVRFRFEDGSELIFADRRNMGKIFLIQDRDLSSLGVLAKLGVEPLSADFTTQAWRELATGDRHGDTAVKELICDQKVIAGIGNVYADAILWQARVRPDRVVKSLSAAEIDRVHDAIPLVLEQGIKAVVSGEGQEKAVNPPRRKGSDCPRCGGQIESLPRGATHSYFCPVCQK